MALLFLSHTFKSFDTAEIVQYDTELNVIVVKEIMVVHE